MAPFIMICHITGMLLLMHLPLATKTVLLLSASSGSFKPRWTLKSYLILFCAVGLFTLGLCRYYSLFPDVCFVLFPGCRCLRCVQVEPQVSWSKARTTRALLPSGTSTCAGISDVTNTSIEKLITYFTYCFSLPDW